MYITDNLFNVGVNDHDIDLFEGQYPVPGGMSYNSYVLLDEKIAVMDTVDVRFAEEWLKNVAAVLNGRKPDYLIIQHMEPDHAGSIAHFVSAHPHAAVVTNRKAFAMMEQYFGPLETTSHAESRTTTESESTRDDRRSLVANLPRIVVNDGDALCLGKQTLTFLFAPMVHWPEVMATYDDLDKVLFSADAFGTFGANDGKREWSLDEWLPEARRYYIGIVGKYGAQVQSLLKNAAKLDVQTICPAHGPILTESLGCGSGSTKDPDRGKNRNRASALIGNLGRVLSLYDAWSSYRPDTRGILIAYASMYGNTKQAALLLDSKLKSMGLLEVAVADLARDDMYQAVADAFRFDTLVLATPTYNADLFPAMREFITHLTQRNFQNRTIALIENGSWAPTANAVMRDMLKGCKNLAFTKQHVTIHSAPDDATKEEICLLAEELAGTTGCA